MRHDGDRPKLTWGAWIATWAADERRVAGYRKLAEAYQTPPWQIAAELPVPQWYALFVLDAPPRSHAEAVERCNEVRARKGLPPLQPKLHPGLTQEMAEANMQRAQRAAGVRKRKEGAHG